MTRGSAQVGTHDTEREVDDDVEIQCAQFSNQRLVPRGAWRATIHANRLAILELVVPRLR